MAEKKNEWKTAQSQVFKFEKIGMKIQGILKAVEQGQTFNNKVYKIEVGNTSYAVFGTTAIDSLMLGVAIGQEVLIEYLGEKENKKVGQKPIKLFNVQYR